MTALPDICMIISLFSVCYSADSTAHKKPIEQVGLLPLVSRREDGLIDDPWLFSDVAVVFYDVIRRL